MGLAPGWILLCGGLSLVSLGAWGQAPAVGAAASATTEAVKAAATAPTAAAPEFVLLDTDIGDDIDDAFALGLVLRSPELKLLGVTTTFGDTDMRARIVDRYLAAAGHREVAVGAGIPTAQKNPLTQEPYGRGLSPRRHADAWVVFSTQVKAHPGQVTLIAIGPLGNLRNWIERDATTFKLLKRVVVMGGSVKRGYNDVKTGAEGPASAEWKFLCDPAGARALLNSGVPVELMPLDATQIPLPAEQLQSILGRGTAVADQLDILYHQWLAGNEWHMHLPVLYDPMTVASVLDPALCPLEPMRLDVDEKGFSRQVVGPANVRVCLKADEKSFLKLFGERLDQPLPPVGEEPAQRSMMHAAGAARKM